MSLPLFSAYSHAIAPPLFGTMVACPLFGIGIAQAIFYFRRYPKDHISVKGCIMVLMLLDCVHMACAAQSLKIYYLRARIDLTEPDVFPTSFLVSYTTTAIVQSAFAYRVWLLSQKNKLIAGILAGLVLIQLGGGLSLGAQQYHAQGNENGHTPETKASGTLELCSAMLCDVVISVTLVFFLHRSRSGVGRTERIVDQLIIYVIGIGSLTAIFTLINFVTWIALPNSFLYLAFHVIISKLYVNSLLVTLNSRNQIRTGGHGDGSLGDSTPLSVLTTSTTVAHV